MKTEVTEIIAELRNRDYDVRSYSGRAMYGKNCVGVDIENVGEVLKIGAVLMEGGFDYDDVLALANEMRIDNMGKGFIVYWPALELSAEQHAALEAEDDKEDGDDE